MSTFLGGQGNKQARAPRHATLPGDPTANSNGRQTLLLLLMMMIFCVFVFFFAVASSLCSFVLKKMKAFYSLKQQSIQAAEPYTSSVTVIYVARATGESIARNITSRHTEAVPIHCITYDRK